jgi:hypothetical protein
VFSGRYKAQLVEGRLGEHHSGELRCETAEAKAERIIGEELSRLGWSWAELLARHKSDPGKLAPAARLRLETTLSIKSIATQVHLSTSKSANARLHQFMAPPPRSDPRQSQLRI